MNPYILPLSNPQADLETVGGKGMSLAKLANAGLSVPDGFHITTEAYRQFVEANSLQASINTALASVDVMRPATLDAASREIGRQFAEALMPGDLANAIVSAYAALPGSNPAVAVRSSATTEDLPEASFAGQQETYLNISGADRVLEATQKCWASLWTGRAIGYRARQEIQAEGVALAVVVQLLVNAEAAGILFTANPMDGNREQAVISAAWGLGEAVVGGAVTPDTVTVNKRTGELIRNETAEKLVMTVRVDGSTQEQAVPEALKKVPVLSERQAAELARIGTQIETLYGMPMDIEWTLADGVFAIVQARPVTALPDAPLEWAPPDPKGTYMRTSITDLMPVPLSPLFVTLGIPEQAKQMQPVGERMIGSKPVMARDYFTSINNYAYMNAALSPRSWWWILTGMLPAYPKLLRNLVSLWRDELHPEYQAAVAVRQGWAPAQMSARALWEETQELVETAAYYTCGLMFATMGASAGSEGLLTRVYDQLVKRDGDPEATTLLMGWDNIPVRSEKSLYDLAMWIREDEELSEYVLTTPSVVLAKQIQTPGDSPAARFSEFARRFGVHLRQFGYIIFQLDFAEPLPCDHPEMLLETVKMYLRGEGSNPHVRQQTSERRRVETTDLMLKRLKGIKLWAFRKALNWGQSMAEVREDALAEIGLAYPGIRELLSELGRRLVEAGAIQQANDIFWLEKDEISACITNLEGHHPLDQLAGWVENRKAFNERAGQTTPPPMMPMKKRVMGIKADVFLAQTEEYQTGQALKGVPTSSGVVTAPACVIQGPEDFGQMRPGDVLVAGTTTPAWTPLFAMASAVVTDIGGPLSHGSIVAREFGIPAVMGTGIATRRIQSGQIVTVDGTKGEVILESTGDDSTGALKPPTEWRLPDPKATYARGSLAEHTPSPVTPLFATLGLRIANRETERLWRDFIGADPASLFPEAGFYSAINDYVYGAFRLNLKSTWTLTKMSMAQLGPMLRDAPGRWQAARQLFAGVVAEWEKKDLSALSPGELLDGASTVFGAAVKYYTVIQTTLPAASMGEIFFTRFYNALVKRKTDPEATTFLFGFETMPARAEQSLFNLAIWLKEYPRLASYVLDISAESLAADFKRERPPESLTADLWAEWRTRLESYFDKFGQTAYEFDFANPTPIDEPGPQFEAIKLYLEGKATNPHERLQTAVQRREQATQSILARIGWPRKNWFEKLLERAQETGSIREDSIAGMGLGHPLIRRMLGELGNRLAEGGGIETAEDIYWLEEREVEKAVAALANGEALPRYADLVPTRKAEWRAALQITPPIMLPQRTRLLKLLGGGEAEEKDGKITLKGLGTSSGVATAPACVLYGPEDFGNMKLGDVLVATTTTPAWTPLFAMASAVVTDIGGPLSHSSIVAREYGIPAVMAARGATRVIRTGQMVTVDGKGGTVILANYK